jgi:hypothetical protein
MDRERQARDGADRDRCGLGSARSLLDQRVDADRASQKTSPRRA